jgi:hypothetical protein
MTEKPATKSDDPPMWKVNALILLPYGDNINGHQIMCEPSANDIRSAIASDDIEHRNYQTDFEALKDEWISSSQRATNPLEEWKRIVTKYHAGRIANFVVNGWDHPISIKPDGTVTDGTHRAKAAIFKGLKEVKVQITK